MRRLSIEARASCSLVVIVALGTATCRTVSPPETITAQPATRPAVAALADTAPSIDALVDQFLAALAEKDMNRLDQLRVSETEYRTFILPGSVAAGQPPKSFPDQPSKYFWDIMNTKSRYWLNSTIAGFAGHRLTRKQVAYAKGVQAYAWYRAYKKVVISVVDEAGDESSVHTGSIAEVNGGFKFISYLGAD